MLKEATQEQLTNGSPSATVGSPRLCESRILDASESSCGLRREASRWLCLLERRRLECPTLCSGALFRTMLLQRRQRGLCYRKLAGADGRLVGPAQAAGGDTCGRLPLPPQLLEVSQAQLGPSSASVAATAPSAGKRASSKRAALSLAPKPSTPKAARRSPANAFQELVVDRLEELSGRLSQLEAPEKAAFASASAQPGFSQKCGGPRSRSSIAGGLTVLSVLGR